MSVKLFKSKDLPMIKVIFEEEKKQGDQTIFIYSGNTHEKIAFADCGSTELPAHCSSNLYIE